ncbi:bifunctional polysaccharide deacetylase/glycosyltransferase family 2 protein [Kitasatospora sp. DSM 101779]|nr:bifunctional polysaccharide deacetylase/glycosyltransferase family 2 protein [Kitasatospora sp. DSM 101779]MCU7821354.1 bifunctional polysaccharide deacetylase/glycosyltransferase family 2 protein [Kitasatospora sp. DSM 101779]
MPLSLLACLLLLIVLRGLATNEVFHDARVADSADKTTVPTDLLKGGPIIDARGDRNDHPVSYSIPDRTVVLSFDDGPSAEWTPKILEILESRHVHADFFVTGAMTARNPDLIRKIVAGGHEIGLHSFTHPDLAFQSHARISWEMAQTQLALAGVAGVHSSLFRPPYSSNSAALDDWSYPVIKYLGAQGYVTAFIDHDTDDWKRPGVDAIVKEAVPAKPGAGELILLHDAGGDRSQTVEALGVLIDKLKADGYRFATITEALGASSATTPVHGFQLWTGKGYIWATQLGVSTLPVLIALLAVVGFLNFGRFALMLVLAPIHARRSKRLDAWGEPVTEPVTVLVPAYNERECIANTLNSLAASDYPIEVIVIDDGSSDGTADIVEEMDLPFVRLIRKVNGGKSSALNAGIAAASYDIVVMMDGDTVFEPSTVRELVQPFADPGIGAVSGNAKVGNRDTLIGAWQHIEYVLGHNLDRRMYDMLGIIPTIPGAVGAFRREALQAVGGMSDDTLAEDTDITMAVLCEGWRVVYAERARAWTEAPASLQQLWSQRYRWSYGSMQAMWKHRRAVTARGPAGRFGRLGLPLVVMFGVVAPLLAPLVDIFLLYGVFFADAQLTLTSFGGFLLIQAVLSWYAFKLDREKPWHLISLPTQQLVYRQLMYIVLLQSAITAVTGGRLRWQKLRRTGEVAAPVEA